MSGQVGGEFIGGQLLSGNNAVIVAASVAPAAGWGSTASVTVDAGSTIAQGRLTVTANGSGIGANPNIVITLPVSQARAPFVVAARSGGTGAMGTGPDCRSTVTTITLQPIQTPVSGLTYSFTWNAR